MLILLFVMFQYHLSIHDDVGLCYGIVLKKIRPTDPPGFLAWEGDTTIF